MSTRILLRLIGADIGQHFENMRGLLWRAGRRRVYNVQKQGRLSDLFKRGAERLHQRSGQMANESHRIARQHLAPRWQGQVSNRGIERGEEARVGDYVRSRQPVKQGGLSGVRVAHQRDSRERNGLPLAPLRPPAAAHAFQLIVELFDAAIDPATVGFQLRLTRAARADATA